MKESITIKNVGPLKNIQIDDIKPPYRIHR